MQRYIAEGKMMDPEKKYRLDEAFDIVGTCQDMCPEFERHEREAQKSLQEFEKVRFLCFVVSIVVEIIHYGMRKIPGTDKVDHQRAVKRYRRAAADDPKPMPCDLRPPPVLMVRHVMDCFRAVNFGAERQFTENPELSLPRPHAPTWTRKDVLIHSRSNEIHQNGLEVPKHP